jgi:hypothetical protein
MNTLVTRVLLGCAVFGLAGCGGGSILGSLLGTPIITGVSPATVARGGTITISGSGLDGTYTTVYFIPINGGSASSVSAASGSTTSVTAVVPSSLTAATYDVDVTVTDPTSGSTSQASNEVSIAVTS